jgi:hypothetical protein
MFQLGDPLPFPNINVARLKKKRVKIARMAKIRKNQLRISVVISYLDIEAML